MSEHVEDVIPPKEYKSFPRIKASKEERVRIKATIQFAKVVGGSDSARTVALFWDAYSLTQREENVIVDNVEMLADTATDLSNPRLPCSPRLLDDPVYLENEQFRIFNDTHRFEIVGGRDTGPDIAPECIALCYLQNNTPVPVGSAVLIAPKYALTAAHVIDDLPNEFLACAAPIVEGAPHTAFRPARGWKHQSYSPSSPWGPRHDIALVELTEPFGNFYAVLAAQEWVNAATKGTIVGYGSNDRNATGGYGTRRYAVTSLGNRNQFEMFVGPSMPNSPIPSACNGDSGGPLYIEADDRRFLAGINSRGMNGALSLCGQATIFTRVMPYIDFFRQILLQRQ